MPSALPQLHIWTASNLGGSSSGSIFLPFHTVYEVLTARILAWIAISSSKGPHFVRTLHYDPSLLGGPVQHGYSFIALHKPLRHDKAVIHERYIKKKKNSDNNSGVKLDYIREKSKCSPALLRENCCTNNITVTIIIAYTHVYLMCVC